MLFLRFTPIKYDVPWFVVTSNGPSQSFKKKIGNVQMHWIRQDCVSKSLKIEPEAASMMRRVKSVFGVMNPCRDEGRSLSVSKCTGQGFIAALVDNQRSSKRRDCRRRKIHFSRWKKKEGPTSDAKILRNIHPFVEVHIICYTTTILHCHKSTKS